ncbi:MAG: ABC transporter permease [Lachnospiraceae bacterium]|nr:ABC transporter permease [Lachnospiraceae bacterium]
MRETKGMKSVFRFTAKQYLKRNGFLRTTIIFAVLLLAGAFCLTFFTGKPKEEKEKEPTEKLGVVEILNTTDLKDVIPVAETPKEGEEDEEAEEPLWDFAEAEGDEDSAFAKVSEHDDHILAIVEKSLLSDGNDCYKVRILIPKDSKIKKAEAMEVGDQISETVKTAVYRSVNMTEEIIEFVMMQPQSRSITTNEDVSLLSLLIRTILPMVLGLVMYMMILLHGQTICKEVSVEKTSKLMETMLVSVSPNALILGKTLALTALALGQFFCWIASAVVGLFAGNIVGKSVYGDEFNNKLTMVLDFLREYIGESALTPASIIMSIVVFCFGIFIYFALAAVGGSFVSKPEETASANSAFVFPLIVFWLITYFASLANAEGILTICRYIPFTAPFCVPVDLLTGNLGLLGGLIICIEVTIVALLIIAIAARIYRGLMLHTGQKISLKTVWATICGK